MAFKSMAGIAAPALSLSVMASLPSDDRMLRPCSGIPIQDGYDARPVATVTAAITNRGDAEMPNEMYEKGLKIRSEVLGSEYVDKAIQNADDFNRDFQEILTEYCWGAVWGRPGLTRQQRSLNNLCMLAALNRGHEFELHLKGALRNGVTLDEIKETLIQVAVYCGAPAAVESFRIARRVLAEQEQAGDD
jgi:4-carboxymuconolactone decarboxylase